MRETEQKQMKLPTCEICGEPVPAGHTICWCCEHEPKLGLSKEQPCGKDTCEINFDVEE